MNISDIVTLTCGLLGTLNILIRLLKFAPGDDTLALVSTIILLMCCCNILQIVGELICFICRLICFICRMVCRIFMIMYKLIVMMLYTFKCICIAIGVCWCMFLYTRSMLMDPSRKETGQLITCGLIGLFVCMHPHGRDYWEGTFSAVLSCIVFVEFIHPEWKFVAIQEFSMQTKLYDVVISCLKEYLQDDNHDLPWLGTCIINR